jgi:rod shape-determining protein MreC
VVSELTPDGALARLVAEPSAANFVMIEPIYQATAVAAAQTPLGRALPDEPDMPASPPAATTGR